MQSLGREFRIAKGVQSPGRESAEPEGYKIPVHSATYCNDNVWHIDMAVEFGSADFGDLFDEVSVSFVYLLPCSQDLVSVLPALRHPRGCPPIRPRIDSGPRPHISVQTFRESTRRAVEPGN